MARILENKVGHSLLDGHFESAVLHVGGMSPVVMLQLLQPLQVLQLLHLLYFKRRFSSSWPGGESGIVAWQEGNRYWTHWK